MTNDPHIVRTGDTDWSQVFRGRHPFNPASEMRMVAVGSASGLKRLGVNLVRIPPGKESFIPHAHTLCEEFAFVLEGRGEAVLDGVAYSIGPGDFVGFPCDGVVHSLRCTGPGASSISPPARVDARRSPTCRPSARPRSSAAIVSSSTATTASSG